jgi:hypothetical protein
MTRLSGLRRSTPYFGSIDVIAPDFTPPPAWRRSFAGLLGRSINGADKLWRSQRRCR